MCVSQSLPPAEMIWASVDWADTRVTLFGDDEAYRTLGKEYSLITLSHRGEFDWLIGYIVATGHGFLQVLVVAAPPSAGRVGGAGSVCYRGTSYRR